MSDDDHYFDPETVPAEAEAATSSPSNYASAECASVSGTTQSAESSTLICEMFQGRGTTDVKTWIENYEALTTDDGWSETAQIRNLELHCSGRCKPFFTYIKEVEGFPTRWSEMRAKFVTHFRVSRSTVAANSASSRLYERHQEVFESGLDFVLVMQCLNRQLPQPLSDDALARVIRDRMRPELTDRMRLGSADFGLDKLKEETEMAEKMYLRQKDLDPEIKYDPLRHIKLDEEKAFPSRSIAIETDPISPREDAQLAQALQRLQQLEKRFESMELGQNSRNFQVYRSRGRGRRFGQNWRGRRSQSDVNGANS